MEDEKFVFTYYSQMLNKNVSLICRRILNKQSHKRKNAQKKDKLIIQSKISLLILIIIIYNSNIIIISTIILKVKTGNM